MDVLNYIVLLLVFCVTPAFVIWLSGRFSVVGKIGQIMVLYDIGMVMSNISELELQNLRHLIGGFETTHCKLQQYATEAQDPQIKQFFDKGAKSAMENKQQLMKFLG